MYQFETARVVARVPTKTERTTTTQKETTLTTERVFCCGRPPPPPPIIIGGCHVVMCAQKSEGKKTSSSSSLCQRHQYANGRRRKRRPHKKTTKTILLARGLHVATVSSVRVFYSVRYSHHRRRLLRRKVVLPFDDVIAKIPLTNNPLNACDVCTFISLYMSAIFIVVVYVGKSFCRLMM